MKKSRLGYEPEEYVTTRFNFLYDRLGELSMKVTQMRKQLKTEALALASTSDESKISALNDV